MAVRRTLAFLGRSGERQTLGRLLDGVRGGTSAVLVIGGEAGITDSRRGQCFNAER
jgi:hypothetical protein